MKDRDRRGSGRLMLISPERVFYAGLLGRPRQRSSGGYNIYAAIRGRLTINDGQSALTGELALVPPYVAHSVESEHPTIICLVIEPETVAAAAMAELGARVSGREAPDLARRIRAAYEDLRLREHGRGFTTAEFDRMFLGAALPDRDIDRRIKRSAASLNDFSGSKMTRGRLRRCGGTVGVALPAFVQAADRRLVPGLSRLEARAASAAFRQRGHQPRASRAGHRLSRLDAFQPFDPAFLRLAAARDLFRLAGSRDLPQRSGRAAPLALARGRKKRNETRRMIGAERSAPPDPIATESCPMSDKAVITCALNGVLTDPKQHHVPVTPEQMAREARAAFDAGASVMHIHLRQQALHQGHLPSWEVSVSRDIQQAIREACPGVIINHTTGTSGPNYSGALDCVRETRPEMAACNAGSLNYLKVRSDNTWAWPPMMFDNAVEKVQDYLDVMKQADTIPEFECFDVGIVRCVGMYRQTGMYSGPLEYNFVMGVASGMPADPELLPILLKLKLPDAHWQVTAIGRAEIWPLHQRCADLGGHLRTGLEDTFYQADGTKVTSNGQLIESIAACARRAGRDIAGPSEARRIFGIRR